MLYQSDCKAKKLPNFLVVFSCEKNKKFFSVEIMLRLNKKYYFCVFKLNKS